MALGSLNVRVRAYASCGSSSAAVGAGAGPVASRLMLRGGVASLFWLLLRYKSAQKRNDDEDELTTNA